jgi:FtsP/CotA-like multicopper oxidase with cupredoxin domain
MYRPLNLTSWHRLHQDTVLVCDGQTVDILFHVINPGLWMAHRAIAEHTQSGMMLGFAGARGQGPTR